MITLVVHDKVESVASPDSGSLKVPQDLKAILILNKGRIQYQVDISLQEMEKGFLVTLIRNHGIPGIPHLRIRQKEVLFAFFDRFFVLCSLFSFCFLFVFFLGDLGPF